MGTIRENKLKHKAHQIARYAYELFASGKGTGSLGISQGEFRSLGKTREELLQGLFNKYYDRLLKAYPEDKWNDQESMTLDRMKIKDVANTLIDEKDPTNLKKKLEFSAYKDLIAPTEEGAKDWYQMDQEQIGKAMTDRGFNPKNRNDVQKFYDKLTEHATAYDRASIVKNTLEGKDQTSIFPDALPKLHPNIQKFAFHAFPSLYEEATKQALTGNYDDWKARRAAGTDIAIGTAMGLVPGGLKPTRIFLKNPGTSKLLDPVLTGLTDASFEGVRQGVDVVEGRDFDLGDVAGAGVAAALVPAAVQGLRTLSKKGNSIYSSRFVKGILAGAKGAENPLGVERNELEQLLTDAKGYLLGRRRRRSADGTVLAANSKEDIKKAMAYNEAKKRLMALGLRSQEAEDAAAARVASARASRDYAIGMQDFLTDNPNKSIPEKVRKDLLNSWGKKADKAEEELENAVKEQSMLLNREYFGIPVKKFPYIEQVLGDRRKVVQDMTPRKINDDTGLASITKVPRKSRPEDVQAIEDIAEDAVKGKARKARNKSVSIDKVLQDFYDNPAKVEKRTSTGYLNDDELALYDKQQKALIDFFPEKMKAEGAVVDNDKAFLAGKILGTGAGWYGRRFEPSMASARKWDERLKQFQNSDWFKNLPKEKKNAIEKALKGE